MTRHNPCKKIEDQLTSYLLGDLPAEQAGEVQAHLESCERCRASLRELKPTLDILRDALAADAGAAARLDPEHRVLARREPARGKLLEWAMQPRVLANAAAVLILCGVLGALIMPATMNVRRMDVSLGPVSEAGPTDMAAAQQVERDERVSERSRAWYRRAEGETVNGDLPTGFHDSAPPSEEAPAVPRSGMDGVLDEHFVTRGGAFGGYAIGVKDDEGAVGEAEYAVEDGAGTFDLGGLATDFVVPPTDSMTHGRSAGGSAAAQGVDRLSTFAEAVGTPSTVAAVPSSSVSGNARGLHVYDSDGDGIDTGVGKWDEGDYDALADLPAAAPVTAAASRPARRVPSAEASPVLGDLPMAGALFTDAGGDRLDVAGRTGERGRETSRGETALGTQVERYAGVGEKDLAVRYNYGLPAGSAGEGAKDVRQVADLGKRVAVEAVDGRWVQYADGLARKGISTEQTTWDLEAGERVARLEDKSSAVRFEAAVEGRFFDASGIPSQEKEFLDFYADRPAGGTAALGEATTESLFSVHGYDDAGVVKARIPEEPDATRFRMAREIRGWEEVGGKDVAATGYTGQQALGQVVAEAGEMNVGAAPVKQFFEGVPALQIAEPAVEGLDRDEMALVLNEPAPVQPPAAVPVDEPAGRPVFRAWGVNPYVEARENPFSTFGIDVDTAAYTLARKHMLAGYLPPPEAVRTEEFVNFFDYGYRAPARATFAVYTEFAPAPFGEGYLLKIGVKGRRLGREEQRRANLTFVIDTSGSMDTADRLGLIKASLRMLVDQLAPADTVAIVQYDSRARLTLDATPAAERDRILAVIDGLQTSGSTHLEEGLLLGYELAARNFDGAAMNRVLLLSDGMANMGSAEAGPILDRVEAFREQGVYCSVFGFGRGTYNDLMLETLANKGDGTYQFIDSMDEARRVFVDDLAATLNVIATDVKIQVEFDPAHVQRYRQLGYENRQLKAEDFRNDAIDAGEVGSGQSVTALYEVLPAGSLRGALGTVRVRYRRADTGEVEEIARVIAAGDFRRDFEQAGARFKLAAAVAEFAEILRGSPFAEGSGHEDVARVLRPVALELGLDARVQELLRLVQAAPGMSRAAE